MDFPSNLFSRRRILAALACSPASACIPFENSSPFWGTIGAGVRGQNASRQIGRDYAAKIPYASMLAWFDGSPKALVVLSSIENHQRWSWQSADGQLLITLGPFVTGLLGTDIELRDTRFGEGWKPNPLDLVGHSLTRSLDIHVEGQRTLVPLNSRFEAKGKVSVEIEGLAYQLEKVREHLSSGGRKRFDNDYWVEASTGRCWKSTQTVVPTMPRLNFEVLKYPAA